MTTTHVGEQDKYIIGVWRPEGEQGRQVVSAGPPGTELASPKHLVVSPPYPVLEPGLKLSALEMKGSRILNKGFLP